MKKIFAIFSVVLILLSFPKISYADEYNTIYQEDGHIEYYSDGSYSITRIETSEVSVLATSTVTKTKYIDHFGSDDEKEWRITVTGTFNYTGSSATCTNSKVSYKIYDSSWKVTSATASKSGRVATGDFTLKRYTLGIPTKTVNETLTITCSNTGVCS